MLLTPNYLAFQASLHFCNKAYGSVKTVRPVPFLAIFAILTLSPQAFGQVCCLCTCGARVTVVAGKTNESSQFSVEIEVTGTAIDTNKNPWTISLTVDGKEYVKQVKGERTKEADTLGFIVIGNMCDKAALTKGDHKVIIKIYSNAGQITSKETTITFTGPCCPEPEEQADTSAQRLNELFTGCFQAPTSSRIDRFLPGSLQA
jgi:hypothetical protein